MKQPIQTAAAPQAIGTYSQAVRVGKTVYLSGQIGMDPATGKLVEGSGAARVDASPELAVAILLLFLAEFAFRLAVRLRPELRDATRR